MAIAALGALPACGLFGPDDWEVRRGVIVERPQDPVDLQIPATVTAGEPTTITLRTHGNGCVFPARTVSGRAGAVLTLEPYDSLLVRGDVLCVDVPCLCLHAVDVTFPAPGRVTIRVVGLLRGHDGTVTRDSVIVVH